MTKSAQTESASSAGPTARGIALDGGAERPGDAARRMLRAVDRAVLSTAQRDLAAWPYGSLVLVAADHDATPLLFLSTLAEHTLNIAADPRVCLLYDRTGDLDDPLTGARVSLLGRAERSAEPRHRSRFVARHPGARLYQDFADFSVYRVRPERLHMVAGFGRIHWLGAADLLLPDVPAALADAEAAIVRHMNDEHAAAVQLYATVLLGLSDSDESGRGWMMTGVDPEGCDLRRGGEVARLDFDRPVGDAESARVELARLGVRARRLRGEAELAALAARP